MKRIILLAALSLCCATLHSQKKKAAPKKGASTVLAKVNNVTAELPASKNLFQVMLEDKGKKDTLFSRKINMAKGKPEAGKSNLPFNCTITPVVIKGTPLYCIAWSENNITETQDKTEDRTQIFSEIWNPVTKTQTLANIQTTTKIKEILWLDKLKNASQTSEKLRREGFEFVMTKDGDVLLKNKTQENRMIYNPSTNVYEDVKSAAPAAKPKKK
jgi:hypothetical protein